MKRSLNISPLKNTIVWGDCKEWLPYVPSSSVDFIFIDPPWNKEKGFEIVWGNCFEKRSFEDRKKGGLEHYISWMKERLIEAKRVLKPTGSIMIQCDCASNYRIRSLLNEPILFENKNFINEIIWKQTNSTKVQSKELGNQISTIFHYAKNKQLFKINKVLRKRTSEEIKKDFPQKDSKGKYRTVPLVAAGCQKYEGRKLYNFQGIKGMWLLKAEKRVYT